MIILLQKETMTSGPIHGMPMYRVASCGVGLAMLSAYKIWVDDT